MTFFYFFFHNFSQKIFFENFCVKKFFFFFIFKRLILVDFCDKNCGDTKNFRWQNLSHFLSHTPVNKCIRHLFFVTQCAQKCSHQNFFVTRCFCESDWNVLIFLIFHEKCKKFTFWKMSKKGSFFANFDPQGRVPKNVRALGPKNVQILSKIDIFKKWNGYSTGGDMWHFRGWQKLRKNVRRNLGPAEG